MYLGEPRTRPVTVSTLRKMKASGEKIRIYQEKSIGASICDVMAVTDKLSGYEIKSDVDNLERLRKQIASYDLFFDRCYIVCGRVHEARLEELTSATRDYLGWTHVLANEADATAVRFAAGATTPTLVNTGTISAASDASYCASPSVYQIQSWRAAVKPLMSAPPYPRLRSWWIGRNHGRSAASASSASCAQLATARSMSSSLPMLRGGVANDRRRTMCSAASSSPQCRATAIPTPSMSTPSTA